VDEVAHTHHAFQRLTVLGIRYSDIHSKLSSHKISHFEVLNALWNARFGLGHPLGSAVSESFLSLRDPLCQHIGVSLFVELVGGEASSRVDTVVIGLQEERHLIHPASLAPLALLRELDKDELLESLVERLYRALPSGEIGGSLDSDDVGQLAQILFKSAFEFRAHIGEDLQLGPRDQALEIVGKIETAVTVSSLPGLLCDGRTSHVPGLSSRGRVHLDMDRPRPRLLGEAVHARDDGIHIRMLRILVVWQEGGVQLQPLVRPVGQSGCCNGHALCGWPLVQLIRLLHANQQFDITDGDAHELITQPVPQPLGILGAHSLVIPHSLDHVTQAATVAPGTVSDLEPAQNLEDQGGMVQQGAQRDHLGHVWQEGMEHLRHLLQHGGVELEIVIYVLVPGQQLPVEIDGPELKGRLVLAEEVVISAQHVQQVIGHSLISPVVNQPFLLFLVSVSSKRLELFLCHLYLEKGVCLKRKDVFIRL